MSIFPIRFQISTCSQTLIQCFAPRCRVRLSCRLNAGSQNPSGTFCYGHIIAIQMGKMGKHRLIMMDIMFPLYIHVSSDITYYITRNMVINCHIYSFIRFPYFAKFLFWDRRFSDSNLRPSPEAGRAHVSSLVVNQLST